jgi:hypothetical protein
MALRVGTELPSIDPLRKSKWFVILSAAKNLFLTRRMLPIEIKSRFFAALRMTMSTSSHLCKRSNIRSVAAAYGTRFLLPHDISDNARNLLQKQSKIASRFILE